MAVEFNKSELERMQSDAFRRVRDMQARAQQRQDGAYTQNQPEQSSYMQNSFPQHSGPSHQNTQRGPQYSSNSENGPYGATNQQSYGNSEIQGRSRQTNSFYSQHGRPASSEQLPPSQHAGHSPQNHQHNYNAEQNA